MIIYLATREEFLKHVREQRIEEEVRERFIAITGRKVAASEFRAWKNSLQCVGNVLQFEEIPSELGVAIEYRIHNTAKRIDLLLSGCDAVGDPAAVIVELKQWESVQSTELDGVVRTFIGKGTRDHSSFVPGHELRAAPPGVNTAVVEHKIALQPCAYLHNCAMAAASLMPATAHTSIRHRCSCATTTQPWRPSCAGVWKLAIGATQSSGSAMESPS